MWYLTWITKVYIIFFYNEHQIGVLLVIKLNHTVCMQPNIKSFFEIEMQKFLWFQHT